MPSCFLLFLGYLAFEKDVTLHLNNFESPLSKATLVEIDPVVLEKKLKVCSFRTNVG